MAVAIDIILLVLSVFIIVKFTITGFFRSVLESCKVLISVGLAFALNVPVRSLINEMFMKKTMSDMVTTTFTDWYASNKTTANIFLELYNNSDKNFYNGVLGEFIDTARLDSDIAALLNGDSTVIPSLGENIGGALATAASSVIAYIVVLVLAIILLSILVPILNKLTEFDGVKATNRILGAVIGVVLSILIMWGVSLGLSAASVFLGDLEGMQDVLSPEVLDKSVIVGLFRDMKLVTWVEDAIRG